jgi:hypothetical protein
LSTHPIGKVVGVFYFFGWDFYFRCWPNHEFNPLFLPTLLELLLSPVKDKEVWNPMRLIFPTQSGTLVTSVAIKIGIWLVSSRFTPHVLCP